MKNKIISIYKFLYQRPLWLSVLILFSLIRIVPVLVVSFIYFLTNEQITPHSDYPFTTSILDNLFAVFLSPIIETLLFQALIVWLFHKTLKRNVLTTIFLAGLIFGLAHNYNIAYIISTFFVGILFAFWYILFSNKYNPTKAFWFITGVHSFNNLLVILYFYI